MAAEADFSMSRYCRSISTETPSTASDARSPCAREAHPIRQHDRLPTTQIPWPGKDQAHAPPRWRLSSLHCFHRLKADRFQLCVAQLAAVDLHESNATSSLAKINKIVANL